MGMAGEILQKGWSFGGSELKCRCRGNLLCTDHIYKEYICDQCDLTWYLCDACDGELHARDEEGKTVHYTLWESEYETKIKNNKEVIDMGW